MSRILKFSRPPTNIYVHSRLVNENSHTSRRIFVIKEPCLSRHRLIIVMKKGGINEIFLSSSIDENNTGAKLG